MSMYGYLAVEGPHDAEFVARILKPRGLTRVRRKSDLDPFWYDVVPTSFPPDGEDLLKRVPVPLFLQNATHSVAVRSALGDTRLVSATRESLAVLDSEKLVGVGFLLDADGQAAPADRFYSIKTIVAHSNMPLSLPDAPGQVSEGYPRSGVFVLPDNQSAGTLEDVLLECAESTYPSLLAGANGFVQGVDVSGLARNDRRELERPAGRNKAIVSSVSSILKPGKAIQVSIQDNRWLADETLNLPKVRAVRAFLTALLEGRSRDGRELNSFMPSQSFRYWNATELEALWIYLRSVNALPFNQPEP